MMLLRNKDQHQKIRSQVWPHKVVDTSELVWEAHYCCMTPEQKIWLLCSVNAILANKVALQK